MFRLAPWKVASILALVFCAALLIVPSFLPEAVVAAIDSRLPGFVPFRPIVLGLDLQGGAHLLMEVDSASVVKAPGRRAARRRARQDARGQDLDQRRHLRAAARRGGADRRSRRARPRARAPALAQPARRRRADRRDRPHARHLRQRRRRDPAPAHRGGDDRQDPPRRHASRSRCSTAASTAPAPRRQSSSSRALDRIAHRSAGPAGHHQGQGPARRDRQARIPPRRRSGRPAERESRSCRRCRAARSRCRSG